MKHTIEVIDSCKKGYRTSVTYLADGVQKDCTGELKRKNLLLMKIMLQL